MPDVFSRRNFLKSTSAVSIAALAIGAEPPGPVGSERPIVATHDKGAADRTMEMLKAGMDPLDAAIAGAALVEANPHQHGVGYAGLPNEDGIVELDAAVMHGPTHGAGAVSGLRNIMHPAAVARAVMKRTRHCLLTGEGALKFAIAQGFTETEMPTPEARRIWLGWKESKGGNWLPPAPGDVDPKIIEELKKPNHGTIHISALDTHGNLGCVTSTSGAAWKISGRVGDSPIIGAGLYLDNEIGSCGSVGMGEVNIVNCACFLVIEFVRNGATLKDAMVKTVKRIDEVTVRDPRFRNEEGKLRFHTSFFGVTKDGKTAGVNHSGPATYFVHDGDSCREIACDTLYA